MGLLDSGVGSGRGGRQPAHGSAGVCIFIADCIGAKRPTPARLEQGVGCCCSCPGLGRRHWSTRSVAQEGSRVVMNAVWQGTRQLIYKVAQSGPIHLFWKVAGGAVAVFGAPAPTRQAHGGRQLFSYVRTAPSKL